MTPDQLLNEILAGMGDSLPLPVRVMVRRVVVHVTDAQDKRDGVQREILRVLRRVLKLLEKK